MGRSLRMLLTALCLTAAACGGGEAGTAITEPPPPTAPPTSTATTVSAAPSPTPTSAVTTTTAASSTITTTTTTTTTMVPEATAEECLASWPIERRLAQLLIPLTYQKELEVVAAFAAERGLGGIVLLGNPDASLGDDFARLHEAAGEIGIIVSVDEEGGAVARLDHLLGRLPTAREVAVTLTTEEAAELHREHGELMAEMGITMSLGPVVDVGHGPAIGDRAFSADPEVVAEYGAATVQGLQAAGLAAVLKHFPGHGRASGDSHYGAVVVPGLDELDAVDLVPYRSLLEIPGIAVMIAHVEVPGLTDGIPASLSEAVVTGLLREQLGFDGLVMTDSLGMQAVSGRWTNAQAALMALDAGGDMLMISSIGNADDVIAYLVEALIDGRLTDARIDTSVRRVLAAKGVDPCAVSPAG